jgi:membrane-bound lytic murein transglycosylase MltF
MVLPASFGRSTSDLDEMVKRRNIRALVLLNPIGFFYDKGMPRGVMYEALEEFQKFANQRLKAGKLNVKVNHGPIRNTIIWVTSVCMGVQPCRPWRQRSVRQSA